MRSEVRLSVEERKEQIETAAKTFDLLRVGVLSAEAGATWSKHGGVDHMWVAKFEHVDGTVATFLWPRQVSAAVVEVSERQHHQWGKHVVQGQ